MVGWLVSDESERSGRELMSVAMLEELNINARNLRVGLRFKPISFRIQVKRRADFLVLGFRSVVFV